MDDLSSLLAGSGNNKDLVDKLVNLLDRQTDHKLSPHVLLGFVGLFNVLTIMNVVHSGLDEGIKEVRSADNETNTQAAQTPVDLIASLLKNQGSGSGSGTPDLMGLLGGLASKKKISPNLLLSLFSMLNNQVGSTTKNQPAEIVNNQSEVIDEQKKRKEISRR